ncbi:MAG: hypothetical protein HKN81_11820, partial [Gammaproteobacteria bacterium]|nr:hypothetical protein [Gammaproteobacteria bacterium]
MTSASAPGKVVLSGEYAVLDGAPAICMAVDRRACATIVESPRHYHSVTAPGYGDIEGRFASAGGAAEWLQGGDVYPLLDAAWTALAPEPRGNLSITLDTRQFFAAGGATKAGLGSSSALTVALVGAISSHLGLPQGVGGTAHDAHRSLQGGRGSGVDVACSIAGGLIEYRMQDRSAGALALPEGLCWALLWSGVASSTAAMIRKLADAATRPSRDALAAASESMA